MRYILNEEDSQFLEELSDRLCSVNDDYKCKCLSEALIDLLNKGVITKDDIEFILSDNRNVNFMIDNISSKENNSLVLDLLKLLRCNLGYDNNQAQIFLKRSFMIDRIIDEFVKNHPNIDKCDLYKEYITTPKLFMNKYIHQGVKIKTISNINEFSSKDYEIMRTDINEFIHRYYYTLEYLYNKIDLINNRPINNTGIFEFLADDINKLKRMYINDLYLDFSGIWIRNADNNDVYYYYPLNCYIQYSEANYETYTTFASIIANYIINKLKAIFYDVDVKKSKSVHDLVSYDDMFEYIIDNASKYHLIIEKGVCHRSNYYEYKRDIIDKILSLVEDTDDDKTYLFKPLNRYVIKGVWKYFSRFIINVLLDILAYCVMDSEKILKEILDQCAISDYIGLDSNTIFSYDKFKDTYLEDVSNTYHNYISIISLSYEYNRYDINIGLLHTMYELYRLNNNNVVNIDDYNETNIANMLNALDRHNIRDIITKDDILKIDEVMPFINMDHLQFLSKDELIQEIKRYINIKDNVYLLNYQGDELSSNHDITVFDGELDNMANNIRSKLSFGDYSISDFIMISLLDPLSSEDGITLNLLNSLIGKYGNLPLYAQLIGSCSVDKKNTRSKFRKIIMRLKNDDDIKNDIIECVSIILEKKFKLNVDRNFVNKFISQIVPNLTIFISKDDYDFHILSDVFNSDHLLSLMNKIILVTINTDDRNKLHNIGLEYIEKLYKCINNEKMIYEYIKRFDPLEWHDALLWVNGYCRNDGRLFDIESLSNILNTISNINDAIRFRRNISKYNSETDDQELPISNLNDFVQRAILIGDRELREVIDQSPFLKPILFAPDLEDPVNYIKRNKEKLKELANGSLNGKQKLIKPVSKTYQYIIISKNLLGSNVISGSDRSKNLRELIFKALGSRRNNIPSMVNNPSGLFKDLNKLLPDNVVSFLNKDTPINNNLYMDIHNKLLEYGMNYDIYDFIAQIHNKSDVQGWLAGSYTDCCMPFGSAYNHDYMFKENTKQFTIQCRKNLSGTHDIAAQSVVVIFDEDNKYNLPKGIILDNIEIARSYQKAIYKSFISDIYERFWTEFSDCPVYIGTSLNDIIPSSDYVDNPYQRVMVNDFIYSDARTSRLYKLRKNPNVVPINKRIVLSNISVNETSTSRVYKLQKEIYSDNKGLWYDKNEIYEILDQSRDNNRRYDKSVNSAFINIGNDMIGYILIAIDDEDFVHLHVYDLAIKKDSNTAYLIAIRYIFGVASANELPIVFEARESTSYKAVKSGVLEKYAKRMGYEKVEDKELPNYMGGETFHRVVLKPIEESLQEDIDYETYLLLYS